MKKDFIAIIDSGIGGISVLNEFIDAHVDARFLYFGDNDNVPYGNKSDEQLFNIVSANIDYIKKYNVKALVIGCNTLSVSLYKEIKDYASMATFGVFPPVKQIIQNGEESILLATQKTAQKYEGIQNLTTIGLSELAKEIEEKKFSLKEIDFSLHLRGLKNVKDHYDNVILGCTHYNFIKNKIFNHFQPKKIISGNYFTVKKVIKELNIPKSLDIDYRKRILFIGKNAKINKSFYVNGGQSS